MKKLFLLSLVLLGTQAVNCKETNREYLERYLASDSLIRQKCKEQKRGFIFQKEASKACDYLDNLLRVLEQEDYKPASGIGGYFGPWLSEIARYGNTQELKAAIRAILPEETDKTKYAEYDKVLNAIYQARAEYTARQERTAKEAEARKQEEKDNPKF